MMLSNIFADRNSENLTNFFTDVLVFKNEKTFKKLIFVWNIAKKIVME